MIPRDAAHARVYRKLLRLYPSEFRERFSDEMVQLFNDQLRDARAGGATAGAARTWLRTLGDLVSTAAAEHARRHRTVEHSLAIAPSTTSRVFGLAGILGGILLLAAFIPNIAWGADGFNLRLVVFNLGAIAIVTAVHRRQATRARLLSLAAAAPAVVANAWFCVMTLLFVGRPQPPEPDPEFRPWLFVAAVVLWLANAAFGLVALRIGTVSRWPALALAIGSLLALTGVSGLGFTTGPLASFIEPLTLGGIYLVGFAWIGFGIEVAFRRGSSAAQPG